MTLNVFEAVLQNLCFKTYYDKIKMYRVENILISWVKTHIFHFLNRGQMFY